MPRSVKKKKATKSSSRGASLKLYGGIFAFGLVVTVGAIMFGRADEGQIDVSAAIANSNISARENGGAIAEEQSNVDHSIPNGGLIGSGKPVEKPKPAPEVEGSATSTDEVASSTEDGTDEDDEALPAEEGDDEEVSGLEEEATSEVDTESDTEIE